MRLKQRIVGLFVALGLMVFSLVLGSPVALAQGDEVTITILHNNDGESNILPDADSGDPGIARFVAVVKELQANVTTNGVITLTSGDNFLASKELNASLDKGPPYYDTLALNGLYDAMALGNHDFDLGPDVTQAFVSGFDPAVPFLSANADFSGEPGLQALVDEGRIASSTIVDVGNTSIGVIGAITPRLSNISSPRGVTISGDVAAVVNAEAAALEDQGVNKIILISHLQGLAQDQELVPLLVGIDVVVAGGGDELLKNDGDTCLPEEDAAAPYPLMIGEIPTVTGPGGYRCVGQLDVTFDADGNVTDIVGSAIGVPPDGDPDPDVESRVIEPLAEAVETLNANVIGTSQVDLDGRRTSVRTMSTNEGQLLADSILNAGAERAEDFGAPLPVIAVANGGGIRNDAVISAGEITEADTFDIAPFGNFVVTGEVPRDTLKDLLENAASGLPEAEGRFAQVAGFTATVDPRNPGRQIDHEGDCALIGDPGSRVIDLTLDDGTRIVADGDVVPGDPVTLATVNFLANGGDCYPLTDLDFSQVGIVYQQALADFIEGPLGGTISEADYGPDASRIILIQASADDTTDAGDAGTDDEAEGDLPMTGVDSALILVVGLGAIAAGLIFQCEGRRASNLS